MYKKIEKIEVNINSELLIVYIRVYSLVFFLYDSLSQSKLTHKT